MKTEPTTSHNIVSLDAVRAGMAEAKASLAAFEADVAEASTRQPRCRPDWLAEAIEDIEFHLARGERGRRSTIGGQLEHAEMYAFARVQCGETVEDGVVVPVYRAERIPKAGDGCMQVKIPHQEASYEPSDREMERNGRASRYLAAVAEVSQGRERVLRMYYGDVGARWGAVSARELSLFPLTPTGKKWIREIRAEAHTSRSLREDEILREEMHIIERSGPGSAGKRAKLQKCRAEATAMLDASTRTLACVVVELRRGVA